MPTTRISQRVLARPDPSRWGEDELMTLGEAAQLFWPEGPITEPTLRTAVRDGRLLISEIAGKFFVTKASLRALSVCSLRSSDLIPEMAAPAKGPTSKPSARDLALSQLRGMKIDA